MPMAPCDWVTKPSSLNSAQERAGIGAVLAEKLRALCRPHAVAGPPVTTMDLHIPVLFRHAGERTVAEFDALLNAVGFRRERVVPTRSPAGARGRWNVAEMYPPANLHGSACHGR